MAIIIDRRLNASGKNFVNRQRFLRRAQERIKEAVKRSVTSKNLKDIGKGENVKIRSRDLSEPAFHEDTATGIHRRVLNGNPGWEKGDTIQKPPKGGKGGRGPNASDGPDTIDNFEFTLSRDEFLDYLFEDLELPDFVKESIKGADTLKSEREGFTSTGSPANLNVLRTFKNSLGRRIALTRPTDDQIAELEDQCLLEEDESKKDELRLEIDRLRMRQKIVPYIDETDLKYNLWVQKPYPKSKAVMFCLMDVSGSMGMVEKDISKRFFLLLYLFLERKYDTVDIRFVRHTTTAEEVDEEKFFYDTLSGGTLISSGLTTIDTIIDNEYNVDEWNFYVAQCTDGDNWSNDNELCREILTEKLLPKLQYFAYIEVSQYDREGTIFEAFSCWPTYTEIAKTTPNLVCKRIRDQATVWTVFRELFEKC